MPFNTEHIFGIKNRVDIRGTVDGCPIERTLLPLGDGRHYVMLNVKILKIIKKKQGDTVYVEIEEQEHTAYKEVELPDYFIVELAENPIAQAEYDQMNPSGRRWLEQFLTEPKSLEAKAKRVIKALEVLERRHGERMEKAKTKG